MALFLCTVPNPNDVPTWGLLSGEGEGGFLSFGDTWKVVEVNAEEANEKLGRWHFGKTAVTILHTGDQKTATQYLRNKDDGAIIHGLSITSDACLIDRGGFRTTLVGGDGSNLRGGYKSYLKGGKHSCLTGTMGSILNGGEGSWLTWSDPYENTNHPAPRSPIFIVGEEGVKPNTNYTALYRKGKVEIKEVV